MSIRSKTILATLATAGSFLAYAAMLEPAAATPPGNGYVQVASAYSQVVQTIQNRLNEAGYAAGPADGLMGSRTRSAIEAYQGANGLLITGQPSQGLLDHIRATAMAQRSQSDPAPQTAAASTQVVIDIQSALRRRGYAVSVVDGEMDDETAAAIRAYQRESNLAVTGRASSELLANLRTSADPAPQEFGREIGSVQQALNARGYSAGPADGVMGPATRNAIRTFQVDAGDPVTGRIDRQLLTRLNIVAADAGNDSSQAAQPRERPVSGIVLFDSFSDGNFTHDPAWTVYRGRFRVDGQRALRSYVEVTQPTADASPQRTGNAAKDTLFAVLEEAFQREDQTAGTASAKNPATIATAAPLDNAFNMQVNVSLHSGDGRFVFGPYQTDVNSGYLLAYSLDDGSPVLRLLSMTAGKTQLVVETRDAPNLDDAKVHRIDWQRRANGRMEVSLDGKTLLRASSNIYRQSFDGFTFTNFGGDFAIHQVKMENRNPQPNG